MAFFSIMVFAKLSAITLFASLFSESSPYLEETAICDNKIINMLNDLYSY